MISCFFYQLRYLYSPFQARATRNIQAIFLKQFVGLILNPARPRVRETILRTTLVNLTGRAHVVQVLLVQQI
jgi:hypothetical protein